MSANLRRFGLLKRAQQTFFVIFAQESFSRYTGHSVHSSVLVVETNCPLYIIKELSTLENNFATEAVLEKCLQPIHVLVVETDCVQNV